MAIVGFSLLGVVIIAIFGLSGQGVRDLRSQVIAAITTLVATIAGFYFGAETARSQAQGGSATSAPGVQADPQNPTFTVGQKGKYTPKLTGTPAPTVSLTEGTLPTGLELDPATGVISGTPAAGTSNTYPITLTATNGISPDATLSVTLTVGDGSPAVPAAIAPGAPPPATAAPGLEADPASPGSPSASQAPPTT